MVVTCGNENFKPLTQISAKFPSFFSLAKTSLSEKNFSQKLSREDFHFSLRKFSFLFFSVSVISLVYILYTSRIIRQSKTFLHNFCGFSVLAFHFSNQQERYFTGKGDILTVFNG